MSVSLWDHQGEAIAQIDAALDAGETRIVVKIPTGGGKTRLASEFTLQKQYIEWSPRWFLDAPPRFCRATDKGFP